MEQGNDTDDTLEVDLDDVARQFLSLYWNMARPYPRLNEILRQTTNGNIPSAMITSLASAVTTSPSGYRRLRAHRAGRDALITQTRRTLAKDVLYRLQALRISTSDADRGERFLYDHPQDPAGCARLPSLTLKPGVAACLRRLRGVIIALVQARWAVFVREQNERLGIDRQLESFLFGVERTAVTGYAARFFELQNGRCFYSGDKLAQPSSGEVDHFIPWARYPFDSPFNLVLATRKINNQLRDSLKPDSWRKRWLDRNDVSFGTLTSTKTGGFFAIPADRETVRLIAAWVYGGD